MHARYKYFSNKVNHEELLDTVPEEHKYIITFDKFEEIVGIFANTIKLYLDSDEILLLLNPQNLNTYQIGFFFTQDEFNQIQSIDPNFAKYLFKFLDRLAVDENGELYDIDENEPASYPWYCYFLDISKEE